ncbi:MAG TPA: CinA family protein [Albitalea sp.]|uniref:CinA family protein n=1 Tax=Piscinibacter sp. TaxID=1903157 RepID=UPI002ED6A04B
MTHADDDAIARSVETLAAALRQRGWTMCTAESCTGGLIAAACTALAGSSDWFERGMVTYSNQAKFQLLGVPPALVAAHGAVSAEVACAMAEGALMHSPADASVAVTGIAGPGGATPGKPVGTVWIAVATRGQPATPTGVQFGGDRAAVRRQSVLKALQLLLQRLQP